MSAWSTYGVLRPDLSTICRDWWRIDTVGRAVAFIQFVSVFAYADTDNPVFARWDRGRGGGPPTMWEFCGHLYEHRWLEPNVDFLRDALAVDSIVEGVRRAASVLAGEPEQSIAAKVLANLPTCQPRLASRCRELPDLLATRQTAGALLNWSL